MAKNDLDAPARLAEAILLPIVSLLAAFAIAAGVILLLGENPLVAIRVMIDGAFLYPGSLGYTLYYATNFIFAGLAVAVAFHAMLFNIGGEGQAYLGGLGIGLACLACDSILPGVLMIPLAILSGTAFGAVWGFIPGWLQAHRGSHIVITTIMFNAIAAAIMIELLSGSLQEPGQSSPETRDFAPSGHLSSFQDLAAWLGFEIAPSPLNLAFILALLAASGVWILIWRTRLGYEIRAVGHNPQAAETAGINVKQTIVITMAISGGLAGLLAVNEVLGVQHKVLLNFTAGYGFTGIAVSLMGRNHPIGIILASLLFGALYQGGTELDLEFDVITPEMVLLIQGLIILFSGALGAMFHPPVARVVRLMFPSRST